MRCFSLPRFACGAPVQPHTRLRHGVYNDVECDASAKPLKENFPSLSSDPPPARAAPRVTPPAMNVADEVPLLRRGTKHPSLISALGILLAALGVLSVATIVAVRSVVQIYPPRIPLSSVAISPPFADPGPAPSPLGSHAPSPQIHLIGDSSSVSEWTWDHWAGCVLFIFVRRQHRRLCVAR